MLEFLLLSWNPLPFDKEAQLSVPQYVTLEVSFVHDGQHDFSSKFAVKSLPLGDLSDTTLLRNWLVDNFLCYKTHNFDWVVQNLLVGILERIIVCSGD